MNSKYGLMSRNTLIIQLRKSEVESYALQDQLNEAANEIKLLKRHLRTSQDEVENYSELTGEYHADCDMLISDNKKLEGELESALMELYGERDTEHLTFEQFKKNWFSDDVIRD